MGSETQRPMTEGQARRAVEPVQDALNDLNKVRVQLQRVITDSALLEPEVAEGALTFHDKMLEAVQAGLEAVSKAQTDLKARPEG